MTAEAAGRRRTKWLFAIAVLGGAFGVFAAVIAAESWRVFYGLIAVLGAVCLGGALYRWLRPRPLAAEGAAPGRTRGAQQLDAAFGAALGALFLVGGLLGVALGAGFGLSALLSLATFGLVAAALVLLGRANRAGG